MRVVAIADQHGLLPRIPECDLLLIAGDICPLEDQRVTRQWKWLKGEFSDWLAEVPAERIAAVAGNHDEALERDWVKEFKTRKLPWVYMENSGFEYQGKKVWGTPYMPPERPWFAFKAGSRTLNAFYSAIRDDTDILVTHVPPGQVGSITSNGYRLGSPELFHHVCRVQPRLHVFGHVHEGRGVWGMDQRRVPLTIRDGVGRVECREGEIILANASLLNAEYDFKRPQKPLVFDLD